LEVAIGSRFFDPWSGPGLAAAIRRVGPPVTLPAAGLQVTPAQLDPVRSPVTPARICDQRSARPRSQLAQTLAPNVRHGERVRPVSGAQRGKGWANANSLTGGRRIVAYMVT